MAPEQEAAPEPAPVPGTAAEGDEDDTEIDLARLCAAFRSLEQLQQSTRTAPTTEAVTPSYSSSARLWGGESHTSGASLGSAASAASSVPRPGVGTCSLTPTGSPPPATSQFGKQQALLTPTGSDPMSRVSGSSTPTPTVGRRAPMQDALPPWAAGGRGPSHLRPQQLGNQEDLPQCLRTPQSTSGNHTPASVGSYQPSVPHARFGPTPRQQEEVGGISGLPSPPQGRGQERQTMDKMDAWFQRVIAKGAEPQQRSGGLGSGAAAGSAEGAGHSPTAAADAGEARPASSAVVFELEVLLGGIALGPLRFHLDESIEDVCRAFVASHRLRDVFRAPLETQLELMVHMDKRADTVDVIDLL